MEKDSELSKLVNLLPELVCIADADGCFEYLNNAWEKTLGYPKKELLSKPIFEFIHPADHESTKKEIERQLSGKTTHGFSNRYRSKQGDYKVLEWSTTPAEGKKLFAVARDITERAKAEKAREESEKQLRSVLETLEMIAVSLDTNGNITFCNDYLLRLTGWRREEVLGKNWFNTFVPSEIRGELEENIFQKTIKTGKFPAHYQNPILTKNGDRRLINWNNTAFLDSLKNINAITSIGQDITERNQMEDALRKNEIKYQQIFEKNQAVKLIIDSENGAILEANEAACRYYGYSKQEILRLNISEINNLPLDKIHSELQKAKTGEQPHFNFTHLLASGEPRNVEVYSGPIEWDGTTALYSIIHDITESRRAKEKLDQSELRYRNLIEGSIQGIIIHRDHKPLFVNQSWASIHGYSVEEIMKMDSVVSLIVPHDRLRMKEYKDARLKGEYAPFSYEYQSVRKDGSLIWLENRVMLVEWGGQSAIQSIIVDITERKKTEQQLNEIKTIFQSLLENSPIYIFFKDHHLRPIYLSRNYETLLGMPLKKIVGKRMSELFPSKLATTMEKDDARVLSSGELIQVDETLNDRHYTTIKFPIILSKKQPMLAGITIDISDRKRAEEERDTFKSQFYQAQKMEAIGNLAGGIAHDFNNILTSIIGFTELALADAEKNSNQQEDLEEVLIAGNRAKELVQQILTFARQSEQETKPVRLSDIINEALKLLRPSTPTTVEIISTIESTSAINGNTSQLHQVVMNICTNAIYSLHQSGGVIEISLRNTVVSIQHNGADIGLPPGEYVELTIADNGPGIEATIIDKIFEPYFTTKDVGEGTGMGLAMVKGIIESCGGDILVKSTPGEKTIFRVRIPVAKSKKLEEERRVDFVPTGIERILFVDDELPIARVGRRMLENLGYSVTMRTSSFEALELFKEKPNEFEIVITDLTMPNMTGDVLSAEIHKIRPDIPIILCTGYSSRMNNQQSENIGVKAFVSKPFSKTELAKTIKDVLDIG